MSLSLSISDLTVSARRDGRALLRVDRFDVAAGSLVGVQGPSGAGKSTFLFALAGMAPAVTGSVRWGDQALFTMPPAQRRAFRARNIGMVFQEFLLFEELGAADNAALAAMFHPAARRAGIRAAAQGYLRSLGLGDRSGGVDRFSGGERQRVAVARALAGDPPVILADEPTASLHRDAADGLADDLCRIARDAGKTLVVATHEARFLDRMDRIVTLRDGVLGED